MEGLRLCVQVACQAEEISSLKAAVDSLQLPTGLNIQTGAQNSTSHNAHRRTSSSTIWRHRNLPLRKKELFRSCYLMSESLKCSDWGERWRTTPLLSNWYLLHPKRPWMCWKKSIKSSTLLLELHLIPPAYNVSIWKLFV